MAVGSTVANEVIAKVGVGGGVAFFANVGADLIVDVVGWFPSTGADPDPDPMPVPVVTEFQAVYVVPSDAAPVTGRADAIAHEVGIVQAWYDGQTGGVHPVFARVGASVSVPTVVIPLGTSALGDATAAEPKLIEAVQAAVPGAAGRKLYIVFEGAIAQAACGWTSSIVLIAMKNCNIYPASTSRFPFSMTYLTAHELTHALGAVPSCAPHFKLGGHVSDDPRDVLYDGPLPRDFANLTLDPGRDDYFDHNRPGCADISDNGLLGSG